MRIGVLGAAGRMGRAVLGAILEHQDLAVGGGCDVPGHPLLGTDLGVLAGGDPMEAPLLDDADAVIGASDVVIEFSSPDASLAHAASAAAAGRAHVIGTTGFTAGQRQALVGHAERAPMVLAANMSLGVNLLLGLAEQVARALDGDAFDAEIIEIHHRHKVDAPSGTALALGEAVARGRGVDLDGAAVRGRDGMTGARVAGTIGFAALRGGDLVGDHTVVFAGAGERIELTHRASDRRIYARGAVQAARWAVGRAPGLYGMADVLGLTNGGDRRS